MLTKEKLISAVKNYYLVIIFSIIVGLLSLSQQFLAISALGKSYNGVPMFNAANMDFYLTRVRDLMDGHGLVSSAFYFEYKNNFPVIFPTNEHLYALIGRIIGLSTTEIILLNQFLFPAFLFLLIYFLVIKLTDGHTTAGRLNAVGTGLLVIFGYEFTDIKFSWLVLSGQLPYLHGLLWNRPVNPIIGVMLLFLLLLILWQIVNKKGRYWSLFAGVIIALGVGYYFTLIMSLSIAGVLALIYFLKKEYSISFNLFLAIIFSFFFSSPYWYMAIRALVESKGGVVGIFGGVFTRQLVFNKVLLAGSAIFFFCFIKEYLQQKKIAGKIDSWWFFCLAFFIGGLAAFNIQVITGINISHPHFVQFTIPLTLVALMALSFNFLRPRFSKIWYVVLIAVFASTLFFGVQTARSYVLGLSYFSETQKFNEMFKWIDINTPKDCVIFVAEREDDTISRLLTGLTHCNIYYISRGASAEATAERNYHNFLSFLRMNEVQPAEVENYLKNHFLLVSLNFFKNWDQLFSPGYQQWMAEPVRRVAEDYPVFFKKDFSTELRRYKIDYLLSPKELSESLLKTLPSIKLLHQAGGLHLYRFE